MKKLLTITIFTIIGTVLKAQVHGAKNQIELEHLSGLQRVNWVNYDSHPYFMSNTIDYNSSFGVNYLRRISQSLQVHIGLSHGVETFQAQIKTYESAGVLEEYDFLKWTSNFQLKFGVKYIEKINNRSNFAVHFGYGQHTQWSKDSKHVMTLSNQDVQTIERSSASFNTGFLFAIPEYQLVLSNKNILSFKLGIQLFNESYKQGIYYKGTTYPWYNPSQVDNFSAKRGNLQFGLGYTFSRQNKADKIAALINGNTNQSEVLRKWRIERRAHSDTAGFLGVQIGAGTNRLLMKGNDDVIRYQPLASFAIRLNYERNIAKNWFLEGGYHFLEYYNSFKIESNEMNWSYSGNIYHTHQFSLGGGYRINYNNILLCNIHAGLTMGIVPRPTYLSVKNVHNNVEIEQDLISSVFASGYLGISKDVHLNNRMILTFNYRFQQGFNPISNHTYTVQNQGDSEVMQSLGRYNGTESTLLIGLKVKIHK